mgnify:CR=1 FL=1
MNLPDLIQLLQARGNFETVKNQPAEDQLVLLGRIPNTAVDQWLIIVHSLLEWGASSGVVMDVSRQYFLKSGKVVYAWRLIIRAKGVEKHYGQIAAILNRAPRVAVRLSSFPIPATTSRNNLRRGKGVQSPLTAVVGKAADR